MTRAAEHGDDVVVRYLSSSLAYWKERATRLESLLIACALTDPAGCVVCTDHDLVAAPAFDLVTAHDGANRRCAISARRRD